MGESFSNFKEYFLQFYRNHVQIIQILGIFLGLTLFIWGIFAFALNKDESLEGGDGDAPRVLVNDADMTIDLLIDLVYDAHGGRARMGNINSYVRSGHLELKDGEAFVVYTYKRPNKLSYRLSLSNRSVRFVWDGKRAWQENAATGKEMEGVLLDSVQAREIAANARLAAPLDEFFTVRRNFRNFFKETTEGDRVAWVLTWKAPKAAERYRFFIDAGSYRVFRRERDLLEPGTEDEVVETISVHKSNFAYTSQVLFPMEETVHRDGSWINTFTIDEYEVNPGILDQYFEL